MTLDGIKGRFGAEGERANTMSHPPIIRSGQFKVDNGNLPVGQVLMRDENSLLVPYTGAEGEVMVGVLDYPIDTRTDGVGEYIVHGTVKERLLTKGEGKVLDSTDLFKLYEIGIYPE